MYQLIRNEIINFTLKKCAYLDSSFIPVHMFPGIHRTVLYALVDQFVNVGIVHAPEVRVKEALGALETTIVKVNTPENNKIS